MACEICGKSTSRIATKEGPADICFACRSSPAKHPVWIHRLENGETRLCLYEQTDHSDAIRETLQGEMPKKAIAALRDLDRRGAYSDDVIDLVLVVWDELPTMIANALAAKK